MPSELIASSGHKLPEALDRAVEDALIAHAAATRVLLPVGNPKVEKAHRKVAALRAQIAAHVAAEREAMVNRLRDDARRMDEIGRMELAGMLREYAEYLPPALAAETGRGEVERYRAALQKIADGEVESRYAREDLLRALYQIQAVRDFAHETLKPQTEGASRGE